MGARCPAEAPYADTTAYCRLPHGHLARWHEGLAEAPCYRCGGRDCHTRTCPTPDALSSTPIRNVRWEGPDVSAPELDFMVKLGVERMQKAIDEAPEHVYEDGPTVVMVPKAALIFDLMLGTPERFREWLAEAEEWGRQITRDIDVSTVDIPAPVGAPDSR